MSYQTCTYFFICLFISATAVSQDYTTGFKMLEVGQFDEARVFFKNQIDLGNDDVTAQLCYGRALGLSGGTEEANKLFEKLVDENPENYELKLNYAESYMWGKQYQDARHLYVQLVAQDSTSFPAVLGYANALSSLKEYEAAAANVEKALIIKVNNPNALVSKKYITMGLAESQKLDNRENDALATLEKIDTLYPNDLDVGMSLAYMYMDTGQLEKAEQRLLKLQQAHGPQTRVYRAQSTIRLRQLEYKQAVDIIKLAKESYPKGQRPVSPTDLELQVASTYISAKRYDEATDYINQLDKDTTNLRKMTELKSNLALAERAYDEVGQLVEPYKGTEFYEQVQARMELQKGNPRQSNKHLKTIGEKYPESVFHYYFSKELDKAFYTTVKPDITFLDDNGGNHVRLFSLDFESTNRYPLQLIAHYDLRNSEQENESSSSQQNMNIGSRYAINKDLYLQATVGASGAIRDGSDWVYNYIYGAEAKYKFSEFHNVKLSYQTNFFDYNVALINSAISENRYTLEYYNRFTDKFGVYTNLTRSDISDDNVSDFIFFSLFHNFTELPLFQVGVNMQRLAFETVSPVYFSPDNYRGAEVFVKYDNRYHPMKKWVYGVTGAIGFQKINDTDSQGVQRVEIEAGYKINDISWVLAFFNFNNAASASVAGFQVTTYGIHSLWRF